MTSHAPSSRAPRSTGGATSTQRRRGGRRAGTAVGLGVALLLALIAPSACDRSSGGEVAGPKPPSASDAPARLELAIAPRTGAAPLTVRLDAHLVGDQDNADRPTCPSLAWDFGNDDVLITGTDDCGSERASGTFTAEYTYRAAGTFEASVRMLASDLQESAPVQVLISGPTPTPPALAAAPGPTIIIATPVAEGAPTRAPIAEATAPPTLVAEAPVPPGPSGAPTPRAAPRQVLPAELYYVTVADSALWHLPATGDAPRPVEGVVGPVDAYAVSPAGLVAYTQGHALWLAVPGVPPRPIVEATASDPLWSRDGRFLAYAADGVWAVDVSGDEKRQLSTEGRPLAWSPDGGKLLIALADGRVGLLTRATGRLAVLPVGAVTDAGWLPDRDIVWLAGDGLRLLSVGDEPTLQQLVDTGATVADGFVRPDLHLLSLVDVDGMPQAFEVDLTDPMLPVRSVGGSLDIDARAGFAWAPDGRTAVAASGSGLRFLDPLTGAQVPLVADASRDPLWVLRGDRPQTDRATGE